MLKINNQSVTMELPVGSRDHRKNEFFTFRYSTRFQKGDILEIRTGEDLEMARFQARKSFPDVLNEYWWLKPSDIPAYKNLPLQVSDIYFYHGGVPVVVLLTANGSLLRKAQVFLKKKEEPKNSLDKDTIQKIDTLNEQELSELLLDQNLLIRLQAAKRLRDEYPHFLPANETCQVVLHILNNDYHLVPEYGELAMEHLLERFFVTSHAKETERIIDTIIDIGEEALPKLDDIKEFLSLMASPYYAKRINWTINQIKKKLKTA